MRYTTFAMTIALFLSLQVFAQVQEVSPDSIKSAIQSEKVVVDFYGDGCVPCQMFAPIFKQVSDDSASSGVTFLKVKLEESDSPWEDFSIRTIPAVILFEKGKEVKRHGSFKDAESFKEFIGITPPTTNRVQEVDHENFDTSIESGDTIVEFYLNSCPVCKKFAPVYEATSGEYNGDLNFSKIELPRGREIANRYNVKHTPTLILFRDGKEKERHVGGLNTKELKSLIDNTFNY